MKRTLVNFVDNAVRLAPEGSTIHIGAGRQGPWAWLAVTDEGPGMQPEEAEHAFDRFWRAEIARTRAGGGAGLGLAIVRQIAEAHGGTARVYSVPGAGTVFVIWLPAQSDAGIPPESSPVPVPRPKGVTTT
jgi:signal transduction histidine kinase